MTTETAAGTEAPATTPGETASGAQQEGQQGQATEGHADQSAQGAAAEGQGQGKTPETTPSDQPVQYTDFTLPEGVKLQGEVMDSFKGIAQKHKLPQDAAQEFVSLGAKMAQSWVTELQGQAKAQAESWASAAKTDKELGGDQFEQNLATANKAFTEFGTPELRALLNESGLGNHPEIIRWAHRVGKALSEDHGVTPKANGGHAEKSLADRLYGGSQTNQ